MTFEQALQKAHKKYKEYECLSALDMGEFWAFHFDDKIELHYGRGYITVNKTTGDLGDFNPVQNLELFNKAKRIDIK